MNTISNITDEERAANPEKCNQNTSENVCCRACMRTKDLVSIFGNFDDEKMSRNLKLVTGLEIKRNDGLPQKICIKCLGIFNLSLQFRYKCKQIEETLLCMFSVKPAGKYLLEVGGLKITERALEKGNLQVEAEDEIIITETQMKEGQHKQVEEDRTRITDKQHKHKYKKVEEENILRITDKQHKHKYKKVEEENILKITETNVDEEKLHKQVEEENILRITDKQHKEHKHKYKKVEEENILKITETNIEEEKLHKQVEEDILIITETQIDEEEQHKQVEEERLIITETEEIKEEDMLATDVDWQANIHDEEKEAGEEDILIITETQIDEEEQHKQVEEEMLIVTETEEIKEEDMLATDIDWQANIQTEVEQEDDGQTISETEVEQEEFNHEAENEDKSSASPLACDIPLPDDGTENTCDGKEKVEPAAIGSGNNVDIMVKERSKSRVLIPKKYKCSVCGQEFAVYSMYIHHYKLHNKHVCKFCGLSCASNITMIRHVSLRHGATRPYACSLCNYATRSQAAIAAHERRHKGDGPFSCTECGKRFRYKQGLALHQVKHQPNNFLKCSLCGFQSISKKGLENHLCNKHESCELRQQDLGRCPEHSSVKIRCAQCLYRGLSKEHLEMHLCNKHQSCEFRRQGLGRCPEHHGKVINARSKENRVHLRTHSGERPYACGACGRRFHAAYNLRQHKLVHFTEKNYKCTMCSYRGKSKRRVLSHFKSTHSSMYCSYLSDKSKHSPLYTYEKEDKTKITNVEVDKEGPINVQENITDMKITNTVIENKTIYAQDNTDIKITNTVIENKTIYAQDNTDIKITNTVIENKTIYALDNTDIKITNTVIENEVSIIERENMVASPEADKTADEIEDDFVWEVEAEPDVENKKRKKGSNRYAAVPAGPPYACGVCARELPTGAAYIKHYNEHNKVICEECGQRCKNMFELRKHVLNMHGPERFPCSHCHHTAATRERLISHERRHTGEKRVYICDHCGRQFYWRSGMVDHIKRHQGRELRKRREPRKPNEQGVLEKYEPIRRRPVPPPGPPYPCQECGQELDTEDNYFRHYRRHLWVVCELCGKLCPTRSLLAHKRARHELEKVLSCTYCDYKAAYKEALNVHLRRHTGERPYICDHCGKSFHTRANLIQHLPIHLTDSNFQCSQCPRQYKSKKMLQIHVWSTHRVLNCRFKCPLCATTFSCRKHAARHIARQHGLPAGARPPAEKLPFF